ncbi:hypothetical protein BDU57DRAFT_490848 [Ampelomyces quisqualis]|uniref:CFEM domain-containing protein n=1 Tax=Ampelomyces quisqualis TaxID=50730 RepID=A0A6A5QYR9_AMPQU|nr:hypothetical protein BDU57DRAFT_490848 [Ampelomyces quisqualis]
MGHEAYADDCYCRWSTVSFQIPCRVANSLGHFPFNVRQCCVAILLSASALLQSVSAQQEFLAKLPLCASTCVLATIPSSACSPSDFDCLCGDTNFMKTAAACNAANCSAVEVLQATSETYAACGVPVRDQRATLMGVTASFGCLALLMVILRLLYRGFSTHKHLGWDDLLIGLTGIVSIGQNTPVVVAARLGFGRDIWGVRPDDITKGLKWLYVAYFLYMLAECLCQLSILAFYLRIMVDKRLRRFVWAFIGIVIGFGITNVMSMIFQCIPISFFWDGWRGEIEGFCGVEVRLFGFIRGAIEIILDLVIITLPLPMLAKLNMSCKKKLQIMSMFCMGFIITIASCLRLWSFVRFSHTLNPTYDNTSALYWCATESNLFIVVACMPAMHAIPLRILRRERRSSKNDSRSLYVESSSKGSYMRRPSGKHQHFLPFGMIEKSTNVDIFLTELSGSGVDLVSQSPRTQFPEPVHVK